MTAGTAATARPDEWLAAVCTSTQDPGARAVVTVAALCADEQGRLRMDQEELVRRAAVLLELGVVR